MIRLVVTFDKSFSRTNTSREFGNTENKGTIVCYTNRNGRMGGPSQPHLRKTTRTFSDPVK